MDKTEPRLVVKTSRRDENTTVEQERARSANATKLKKKKKKKRGSLVRISARKHQ